eukprot:scaffold385_cov305-Pinguiococcus_pyrenoidosus.AAC.53
MRGPPQAWRGYATPYTSRYRGLPSPAAMRGAPAIDVGGKALARGPWLGDCSACGTCRWPRELFLALLRQRHRRLRPVRGPQRRPRGAVLEVRRCEGFPRQSCARRGKVVMRLFELERTILGRSPHYRRNFRPLRGRGRSADGRSHSPIRPQSPNRARSRSRSRDRWPPGAEVRESVYGRARDPFDYAPAAGHVVELQHLQSGAAFVGT